MTAEHQASPSYRRDIDGLRAVAVLSVLAFHAFPNGFSGGFVGVDIFFVISGFLISGILFEQQRDGRFSYADFYARRIKRLFPTLIIVLACSLVAGWFLFYPMEFQDLGWQVFAGSAFFANISLLLFSGGYFDGAAEYTPLLHLWSLGVEEQFYIFWPLIIGLIWYRERHHALTIIALIALASLILNVSIVHSHPSETFYLPLTRFWELLAGAMLAYRSTFPSENAWVPEPNTKEMLSWLGLLLIVTALFCLNKQHAFPGWWALLPVGGTALMIFSGPDTRLAQTLLANRLMVFVGLISYPLYLWHWPLLVYARILMPDGPGLVITCGLLLCAFLLAWISYRYVEGSLRHRSSHGPVPKVLFAILTVIALLGLYFNKNEIPTRLMNPQTEAITDAMGDWEYPGDQNFRKLKDFSTHKLNDSKKPHQAAVMLIGDSHIEQYWSRLNHLANKTERANSTLPALWFATYGSCPPIPQTNIVDPGFACHRFLEYALQQAQSTRVTTVVFGAWWEIYFGKAHGLPANPPLLYDTGINNPAQQEKTPMALTSNQTQQALARFEQMLRKLKQQGKTVYVVLSNPSSGQYDPRRMINRVTAQVIPATPVDLEAFRQATAPVTERIRKAALAGGAIVLDPADSLCKNGQCPTVSAEGDPLYKDSNHLRPFYSAEGALFIDRIMTGK